MNLASLKSVGTRSVGRGLLTVRKFSPEILTAVGIVGVVGAAVLASRATLKLEKEVTDLRLNVEAVKEAHEETLKEGEKTKEYSRDMTVVYTRSTLDIAKLYTPAVTVGIASIACLVGAHGIMRRRNVALAAALTAVEKSFGEYRKRVHERFGEEVEREVFYDVKEIDVVGEDGKTTKVKTINANATSPYAKFFDELNPNYTKTPEYNQNFLRVQQTYANDRLQADGHLFLNDVYTALGLPITQAGQVVGWKLGLGDDYVDFGILNPNREMNWEFVNGYEAAILLDFNVDGEILGYI